MIKKFADYLRLRGVPEESIRKKEARQDIINCAIVDMLNDIAEQLNADEAMHDIEN
jgi:hypothetical protein